MYSGIAAPSLGLWCTVVGLAFSFEWIHFPDPTQLLYIELYMRAGKIEMKGGTHDASFLSSSYIGI